MRIRPDRIEPSCFVTKPGRTWFSKFNRPNCTRSDERLRETGVRNVRNLIAGNSHKETSTLVSRVCLPSGPLGCFFFFFHARGPLAKDAAAAAVRIRARGREANEQNHVERGGLRPREDG